MRWGKFEIDTGFLFLFSIMVFMLVLVSVAYKSEVAKETTEQLRLQYEIQQLQYMQETGETDEITNTRQD